MCDSMYKGESKRFPGDKIYGVCIIIMEQVLLFGEVFTRSEDYFKK